MQTFQDRLTEEETSRHNRRIAEIRLMQDVLVLAEPVIKKLEARLKLDLRLDMWLSVHHCPQHKAIHLAAMRHSLADNAMHEALIAFGFVEIDRVSYGMFDEIIVLKDTLAIALSTLPGYCKVKEPRPVEVLSRRHNDAQVTA